MKGFWNQLVFDNPLKKYLFVFIAIFLVILLKRLISKFVAVQIFRGVKAMDKGLDKNAFVRLMVAPLETFFICLVTIFAIDKLRFPGVFEFEIFDVPFKTIVHGFAITVIIVVFIWLLLRTVDFIALLLKEKTILSGDIKDHSLVLFFRDFLKVIIAFIGVLMVLGIGFGFEVSRFWTGLGLAGAALALSLRESIENLIASFIIFFNKPFRVGDNIKLNNISGMVELIGLRSTRVRTDLKTFMTVPNKMMVDSIVDNQTLRTYRKAEIRLQLDSSTPAETIHAFISDCNKLLSDEAEVSDATVFLNDISGTSYLVNIDYFMAPVPLNQFNALKQKLNLEILHFIENRKIEIAGSGMTVKLEKGAGI